MAKQALCKKAHNPETGIVTFAFTNGRKLDIDPAALPTNIWNRLVVHGLLQKVGDSYAGAATADDAYDLAAAVVDSLMADEWNAGRESTGGVIVEALARILGKTVDEAKAAWTALDEAKQKVLAKEPRIAAMVAKIKLERAERKLAQSTEEIDLGGLFSETAEE